MNAVGIDVSKGKSTVAILRPFGEIVVSPFNVSHSPSYVEEQPYCNPRPNLSRSKHFVLYAHEKVRRS